MKTQDWINEQKIEAVQDRKDGKDYWKHDNLYTETDLIEMLEAFAIYSVSHCGLTSEEVKERAMLLRLQSNHTRWFTKQEFDRLKELSNKMFKNAGSPHCG